MAIRVRTLWRSVCRARHCCAAS